MNSLDIPMVFIYICNSFIIIWSFSNEHRTSLLRDLLSHKGNFSLNGCSKSAAVLFLKILWLVNLEKKFSLKIRQWPKYPFTNKPRDLFTVIVGAGNNSGRSWEYTRSKEGLGKEVSPRGDKSKLASMIQIPLLLNGNKITNKKQ